jgi:hypothetical protein
MVDNEISGSEINTAIQAGTIGNIFFGTDPNKAQPPTLHQTYLACLRAAEQIRDLTNAVAHDRSSRAYRRRCVAVVDQVHSAVDTSKDAFAAARISAPRAVIEVIDPLQSAMVRVLESVSAAARHGGKRALEVFLSHSALRKTIDQYISAIQTARGESG